MNKYITLIFTLLSFFWFSTECFGDPIKKIKFATEATYPPFVTMNISQEIGGFETELVKILCEEANISCEFNHLPFDSLFPNLTFKKIDAVYGCIGITKARKEQVLFTKPLYLALVGFIYQEAFEEKTIGIQQGTPNFESYLKKHFPNAKLKSYPSIQDALLDLKNQRIQAVFGDIPVFKHWLKKTNEDPHLKLLELTKEEVLEFSEGNGIAVRKEDKELIEKLNVAFDKIVANGTFHKLKEAYLD